MAYLDTLAEEARRLYYGGDPPVEAGWLFPEALVLTKQALSEVAKEDFFLANKMEGQHTPNSKWQVTYPVNLVLDSSRSCKYFLLPEAYLSLPGDKAVVSVTYNNDRTAITYMKSINRKRGSGGTAVETIDDYYYALEADRGLVYSARTPGTIPFTPIWVTLAVANATTATQSEGLAVVARTLQLYNSTQKHKDSVSDNLDTPTNP